MFDKIGMGILKGCYITIMGALTVLVVHVVKTGLKEI